MGGFIPPTQSKGAAGASTNKPAVTLTNPIVGGNLSLAIVSAGPLAGVATTISSVTNDKGDTYTLVDAQAATSGTTKNNGVLAYCLKTTAGAQKITATLSQAASVSEIIGVEYAMWEAVFDAAHTSAHGTGTSAASGTSGSATTRAIAMILGWLTGAAAGGISAVSSPSPASDLLTQGTTQLAAFSDGNLTSTGTQSASYSLTGTGIIWCCGVATFYGKTQSVPRNPAINHQNPAIL